MSLIDDQPTFDETIEKLAEREGIPRYADVKRMRQGIRKEHISKALTFSEG
jgi:hypothetical protein